MEKTDQLVERLFFFAAGNERKRGAGVGRLLGSASSIQTDCWNLFWPQPSSFLSLSFLRGQEQSSSQSQVTGEIRQFDRYVVNINKDEE